MLRGMLRTRYIDPSKYNESPQSVMGTAAGQIPSVELSVEWDCSLKQYQKRLLVFPWISMDIVKIIFSMMG